MLLNTKTPMNMNLQNLILLSLLYVLVPSTSWAQDGALDPLFQDETIHVVNNAGLSYAYSIPTALHFDRQGKFYFTFRAYLSGLLPFGLNTDVRHIGFNAHTLYGMPSYGSFNNLAEATSPLSSPNSYFIGGYSFRSIFFSETLNNYNFSEPEVPVTMPDRETFSLVTATGETYIAGSYMRSAPFDEINGESSYIGYFVTKLTSNGQPDATFNTTGTLKDSLRYYKAYNPKYADIIRVWGIVQQSSGHVVLAHTFKDPLFDKYYTMITRIDPSGSVVKTQPTPDTQYIKGLGHTVDAQDRSVIAYSIKDPNINNYIILFTRYTVDLESIQVQNGLISSADSILVRQSLASSDGKLYVLYESYYQGSKSLNVVRLNADLSLDTGYGTSGYFTESFGGAHHEFPRMVQQRDGKLVIVVAEEVNTITNTTVMRLTTDGTKDATFGTQGVVKHVKPMPPNTTSDDQINSFDVKLADDGSIVIGDVLLGPNAIPVNRIYALKNPSQFYNASHLTPANGSVTAILVDHIRFSLDQIPTPQAGKYIRVFTAAGTQLEQIEATDARVTLSADTLLYGNYLGPRTGKIVSVELSSPLAPSQQYYVLVDSGAFKNAEGFDFWGIQDNQAWNFSVPQALDQSPGYALTFDGSDDRVSVPVFSTATDNITLEAWVKWSGGTGNPQIIVSNGHANSDGYAIALFTDNRLSILLNTVGWFTSDTILPDNTWVHVALVRDNGTWNLYHNGSLITTATTNPVAPSTNFYIGGEADPFPFPFNGSVDEVKFWSTARSAAEIRSNMHTAFGSVPNDLIASWQFNEGNGSSTATDFISGYEGTLDNMNTASAWVNSTIPFGEGTSASTAAFTAGTANLGTVSLTTTDDFDAAVDLTAAAITAAPNENPTGYTELLTDQYWVINEFGTPGIYSADLAFTVPSSFTSGGTYPASEFRLFRRQATSDGDWTLYKSGASTVGENSVTFTGINALGQFMVGRVKQSIQLTGTEGWRLLSSPITSSIYSTLLSDFWTQGFTGATNTSGTSNVYVWDNTTTDNSNTNWSTISNLTDAFSAGSGVLVYVYSDDDGPGVGGDAGFPKTLSVTGTEISGTQSLNSLLNDNADGWTLLGNPFLNDIDWDLIGKANLHGSVYIWDHNSSDWKTWNGTTGDLTDGIIPAFNGFFVQTLASSPTLAIAESTKVDGDQGFLGKSVDKKEPFVVALEVTNEQGMANTAWINFNDEASKGRDAFDALKLEPLSAEYMQLSSLAESGELLDINNYPITDGEVEIPVNFETTYSGKFRLSVKNSTIPDDWKLELRNNVSGEITGIEDVVEFDYSGTSEKVVMPVNFTPNSRSKVVSETMFSLVITMSVSVHTDEKPDLPKEAGLSQNYPNPFNPSTVIRYQIPVRSKVQLQVFDMLGRKVATLIDGSVEAGYHQVTFNGRDLASGIYIYQLRTGSTVVTKKLILIK